MVLISINNTEFECLQTSIFAPTQSSTCVAAVHSRYPLWLTCRKGDFTVRCAQRIVHFNKQHTEAPTSLTTYRKERNEQFLKKVMIFFEDMCWLV